jgi:predicted kinase
MSKRGFALKELAGGLQAQNIPVKPATLNRYLNEYKANQGDAVAKASRKKIKEPDPGEETGTVQESADADETSEAETKAEVPPHTESTWPSSETAAEKSETVPSNFWSLIKKNKEQNPLRPPEENLSGFRI